ncbi:hypothetical protein PR202_ga03364 [Eleusine coracana subsp. coracana]|uniref:Pentatricopeptide repeat-containing protein n=1 Tax=Eleusine coracana subsp. coracana TaxID=191504 RepID=A0AAV5BQ62_ELECO|nr:hypothetical protein PR202_ga03364 [Eleusine coracana subsp. coracana]
MGTNSRPTNTIKVQSPIKSSSSDRRLLDGRLLVAVGRSLPWRRREPYTPPSSAPSRSPSSAPAASPPPPTSSPPSPPTPPAPLLRRLIPALASAGLVAAAVRFRPVPGDPLTLNSIILSYCSLRLLRPALSLLRASARPPWQAAVDTVSYNIFLTGLSEQGRGELAPAVLAEMSKRGVPFDGFTINTVLVGLCRKGSSGRSGELGRGAGQRQSYRQIRCGGVECSD